MKTPIVDFVREYARQGWSRFHMPGHKGRSFLGIEARDITEITGADVLSDATGIIEKSEEIASSIFSSAHSYYVTQGSTTAICAMLAMLPSKSTVLAARNVHRSFVHACALLDLNVKWLMPQGAFSLLKCPITAELVEETLQKEPTLPSAVYLTSPDYLGNLQDVAGIAAVCKKHHIPLFVDNAHGAYLKFLDPSMHPLDLGATVCCDSAHKTLPVLTGGAYLHIAKDAPQEYLCCAREKLALFSSTSPSYLVLQSLDFCNRYLYTRFPQELAHCIRFVEDLKTFLSEKGFYVLPSEPLKIAIDIGASLCTAETLVRALRAHRVEPEFWDKDYLVLMVTPQNTQKDFNRLKRAFCAVERRCIKQSSPRSLPTPVYACSIREALLAEGEEVPTAEALGRICAAPTVSCPPAVPIAVSGEVITKELVDLFLYYGIAKIKVVK